MNHKNKTLILAGAALAVGAASAFGQATGPTSPMSGELPDLSAGTRELGVSGNLDWTNDTSYNLNVTYAWFTQDAWEVGGKVGLSGVEDDYNFSLGLFTEYNFVSESKWVPFVGGSLNWATLESDVFDGDSITVGLNAGIKYFLQSNLALSLSIGADYAFDDVFPEDEDFNKQINIGTRFYF